MVGWLVGWYFWYWGFNSWGYRTRYHPFEMGIFHYKPSSYWVIVGKSVAWVILALLGDGSNFRLRRLDIESIWVWINTYKNTIFSGMNIHLPAILMFTRGTRFWHTAILLVLYNNILTNDWGTQPLTKPFLRNFSGLQKLLISSRLSSLVALPWLAVLHPTRPRIIPKEGRFPALQLDQLPFLWVYRPPMGAELHSWFFRSGNRTWLEK
jgi:hypothetical protein